MPKFGRFVSTNHELGNLHVEGWVTISAAATMSASVGYVSAYVSIREDTSQYVAYVWWTLLKL